MANELKINLNVVLENGNHKEQFTPATLNVNQDAVGAWSSVVAIGTSEEDIAQADISTLGWAILHNIDATNYVTYGPKSGGSMVGFGRLEPGEFHVLRLEPGITIRAIADTAACNVKITIFED